MAPVDPMVSQTNSPSRSLQPDFREDSLTPPEPDEPASVLAPASALPLSWELLTSRIKSVHERVRNLTRKSRKMARLRLALARQEGDLLIQLKDRQPHGEWETFVLKECGISPRTARDYMTLADNWPFAKSLLNSNRRQAADLTMKRILKLISNSRTKVDPAEQAAASSESHHSDGPTPTAGREAPPMTGTDQPSDEGHQTTRTKSEESERAEAKALDQDDEPEVSVTPNPPGTESGEAIPEETESGGEGRTEEKAKVPAKAKADARTRTNGRATAVEKAEGLAKPAAKEQSVPPSSSTGIVAMTLIERANQFQEQLVASLSLVRPNDPGPCLGRLDSIRLWQKLLRPFRAQFVKLLTATSPIYWGDCETCGADGRGPSGEPCGACAGTRLLIAAEYSTPNDAAGPDEGVMADGRMAE